MTKQTKEGSFLSNFQLLEKCFSEKLCLCRVSRLLDIVFV